MRQMRSPNVFERILLVVGIVIIIVFGFLMQNQIRIDGFYSWACMQTILLWAVLLAILVLISVNENLKEELRMVLENQTEQLELLRQGVQKKK